MNRYIYQCMIVRKARVSVIAKDEDEAWDELMSTPDDEWETIGVPVIEDIEVLDVMHDERDEDEDH